MRNRGLAGLFLACAAFTSTARAGDDAAAVAAYERARAHLKAERWSTAVDSLRRVLSDYPDSKAVLDRLEAIEVDLRLAMFRAQSRHPAADVLFGEAAVGFVVSERRLSLDYPKGPRGSDWTGRGDMFCHRVPFESDLAVEFTAPTIELRSKTGVSIYLNAVNPKDPTALLGMYWIAPGACSEDTAYIYSSPGMVVREDFKEVGKSTTRTLASKPTPGKVKLGEVQTYRVVRRDAGINVSVDGKPFLVCQDGKYPVTTVTLSAAGIGRVTLRGVVEKAYYLDLLHRRLEAEQREWEPKGYVRAEVLPQWVLDAAPRPPAPPEGAK